jgi:hypothetical protein
MRCSAKASYMNTFLMQIDRAAIRGYCPNTALLERSEKRAAFFSRLSLGQEMYAFLAEGLFPTSWHRRIGQSLTEAGLESNRSRRRNETRNFIIRQNGSVVEFSLSSFAE